uniref:Zn-dependent metallo-hydrolase RNA specificity domain-containing protein n=1 Tax=Caldiarchaeum subterraneum TaxID=311458 RepID=A0A7J3G479_CALS0
MLLNQGRLVVDNLDKPANCIVKQFRFSGHAGRTQLHDYLRKIETNAKVFTVHGEPEMCKTLSTWAQQELGLEATAPRINDTVTL